MRCGKKILQHEVNLSRGGEIRAKMFRCFIVLKGRNLYNPRLKSGVVATRPKPCPPQRGGTYGYGFVTPFQGEGFEGGRYPQLTPGVIEILSLQDRSLQSLPFDFNVTVFGAIRTKIQPTICPENFTTPLSWGLAMIGICSNLLKWSCVWS